MSCKEMSTLPPYQVAIWEDGNFLNMGTAPKWSKDTEPPPVGTEIIATINGCGPAVVTGYFVQDGWLGLCCTLHNPPDWHLKQNGGPCTSHVFGPEFRLATHDEVFK
jgi:hypothetical protein